MAEKTLSVEGMSCGHCKGAVEGELNKRLRRRGVVLERVDR
jgi:hypothetical protein